MADTNSFDVIVIGGGPAGYPAAIRAGQNKLSVACIDEWKNLDGAAAFGGTCLNAGCIPSKALLESSELYHRAQSEFAVHGIKTSGVSLDLATMQKRKATIVKVTVDTTSLPASWHTARTSVIAAVTSIARLSVLFGGLNRVTSPVPAGTPAIGQVLRTA